MINTQIDVQKVQRNFNRIAHLYDQSNFLEKEIANRLLEDLEFIKIEPSTILDLGCGTGYGMDLLQKRYPKATLTGCDFAREMLKYNSHKHLVCADILTSPFEPHSFDMIFSNCLLHLTPALLEVLKQIRQLLRPGGLFIFSTFGLDTLKELHHSWEQVDNQPHIHPFIDMHDFIALLSQTGFTNPFTHRDDITIHYDTVDQLCQDLKNTGKRNALFTNQKGLTTPRTWEKVITHYEAQRTTEGLPATFEIITGHGFAFR